MEKIETSHSITVWRPHLNDRCETHLEFTLYYVAADGRTRWDSGTLNWDHYESPEDLVNYVLRYQTAFVNQRWVRIEVHIPNRDRFGNLVSGFIKDTGFLLATRDLPVMH